MSKKKFTPEELMNLAIEESLKSIPEHEDRADPFVGALLATQDGEILGTAFRGELRIGEHCEYTLIERKLKDHNLRGHVLYVTLEPCVDAARKQPKRGCATHIHKARIGRVYIGMRDPNPKVENQGAQFLMDNGIEVIDFPDHLQSRVREVNAKFIEEQEINALRVRQELETIPPTYLDAPVLAQKMDRLSSEVIRKFLDYSKATFGYPSQEFEQWSDDFGLAERTEDGKLHPTRLGLMLFGDRTEDLFPHLVFKVELDYGDGEVEIKDFGGPLASQLPDVLDFVRTKGLKLTIDRSLGQREEKSDFPFSVLREAISNAVIHRDYAMEGATNYLYIGPDKIIIRSPGHPIAPLTIQHLRNFNAPSISRNPKVMYLFNRMGFAEQRGLGLRNMKHLREIQFSSPKIEMIGDLLEISFSRFANTGSASQIDRNETEMLAYIAKMKEVAVGEFAKHFELNPKTAQRRLNDMVERGALIRHGEKRGTRYSIGGNEVP